MIFNSWTYLIFLVLVTFLFWNVPRKGRVLLVCFASVFFYSLWRWEFVFLILLSAIIDFESSKRISRSDSTRSRLLWLTLSLSINLGLLLFFKYTFFFCDNVGALSRFVFGKGFSHSDLGFGILLPLGISFYTFQTISYTIDVYRRVQEPSKDFFEFFAYVIFWPQLIAGPILRASEVIPELNHQRPFELRYVAGAATLIVTGLFKKVALADNIAPYVDMWFSADPVTITAVDVWVAAFLFGFQIYFDFSGYSDIAIGSALGLGIVFPMNFNWPYLAVDPKSFWQRWHISLSSWIRDYLYLPLTGQTFQSNSKGGLTIAATGLSRNRALFLTWIIMGFWHGANWTFVCWGLYHGILVFSYRAIRPLRSLAERAPFAAWLIWLPLSMFGWIFFRAETVSQALALASKVFRPGEYYLSQALVGLSDPRIGWAYLGAACLTSCMSLMYYLQRTPKLETVRRSAMPASRCIGLMVMTFCVLIFLQQKVQFIYFQF